MRMPNGARVGPYEILAPLGAGGMGEVYRARDSRLKRDVAIKILPPEFLTDEERLARFTREAQALAALNHPNIASIYGVEETPEGRALVMELVEGRTLADRLEQGPIDLEEAVRIARQLADALEAAHEKGIIHRDLKPANIAFTPDGDVKVLDFGLAKALEPEGATDPSLSPTLTLRATQAGVILGTAAYMSPEQARGRAADKRTDVWAFGCVFYEMLTGKRAFEGEDVTDTIAAVVRAEPDWSELTKRNVPAQIELLIRRCLIKDRKQRISDIGVARFLLSEVGAASSSPPAVTIPPARSRRRTMLAATAGVMTGIVAAGTAFWGFTLFRPASPPQPMRFAIVLPQPLAFQGVDRDIAISPDGTHLAYRAGSGQSYIVVRALNQLDGQSLTSSSTGRQPFFSPDGRWVGFFASGELKKVSVTGGPAITVCKISGAGRGATWGEDDIITFATNDLATGLLRVPAAGGEPTTITTPDSARGEADHMYPSVLPGGRGVLFTVTAAGIRLENLQVAVLDAATKTTKTIIRGGSDASYVASGHVVYAVPGSLRGVRFDLDRLDVAGDAVPVVDQLSTTNLGAAGYAISRNGTLIFVPGFGTAVNAERSLVWVDRNGREQPIDVPPRAYFTPRLSPDGTRIAVEIRDQEQDIWVLPVAGKGLTRLTFAPGVDALPLWTPDSKRLFFSSVRTGLTNVYTRAADGTGPEERLIDSPNVQNATSISPDGTRLIIIETNPKTGPDVVSYTTGAAAKAADVLIRTPTIEWLAEVSPDGRWLAYSSNESSQFEVFVRPFPNVDAGRWQVSTGGGTKPAWARNGKELFYVDNTNNLLAVPVQSAGSIFGFDQPVKLIEGRYFGGAPPNRTYDVSPDGQRFLMIKDSSLEQSDGRSAGLVVVLNWFEELKQRVGTTR
jgi:serine/threonine protein kinase